MTKYNRDIHHRRSIRLKGYDYSQPGLYFITICTQNREHLFGKITDGEIVLNDAGKMIEKMPNHFHGIIQITTNDVVIVGADLRVCPDKTGQPHDIGQSHDDGQPCDNGQPHRVAPTGGASESGEYNILINKMRNGQGGNTGLGGHTGPPQPGPSQPGTPQPGPHKSNPPLHEMVQWFKTMTTNEYIRNVKQNNWPRFNGKLWQRNYYEHIIRNEKSYYQISEYIRNNPIKWQDDRYYA